MATHFQALGFTGFTNQKRDFYLDVTNGDVPPYDILVTNPPYSGDHKERALAFCVASKKPWALLMPSYVASKQYFTSATAPAPTPAPAAAIAAVAVAAAVAAATAAPSHHSEASISPSAAKRLARLERKSLERQAAAAALGAVAGSAPDPSCSSGAATATASEPAAAAPVAAEAAGPKAAKVKGAPPLQQPFYLVPNTKYVYDHPEGTGHAESPFSSIWFVHMHKQTDSMYKWMSVRVMQQAQAHQQTAPGKVQALSRCCRNLEELKETKSVPTARRMNPKQRKKMQQRMGGGGKTA